MPEVKIDIAALLLNSGPYNLQSMLSTKLPFGVIPELASMLTGRKIKEDLSDIYDYEYFEYMSTNEFVNDNWCPVFISWSDSDFVCPNQGRPMAEKLMKHCPRVATSYADGLMYGHDFHLTIKNEKSIILLSKLFVFSIIVSSMLSNGVLLYGVRSQQQGCRYNLINE